MGNFSLVHFIIYSRSYCHLCEEMLKALHALSSDYSFTTELVDVDLDESLCARFDELVPVLVGQKAGGEAVQLCHYFLDEGKTRAFLASD